MENIGRYILSVIAASFVVGILGCVLDQRGPSGGAVRLIGGLFLTFTVISPIVQLDFSGITDFWEQYAVEGDAAAAGGEALAQEEYRTIIIEQVEAYILDKANELGAALTVEVTLSNDDVPLPEEVILRGSVSPYAKSQLQGIIEENLAIAKEKQLWIG